MMHEVCGAKAEVLDPNRAGGAARQQPWPPVGRLFSDYGLDGILDAFPNLAITPSPLPFGISEVSHGDRIAPVTEEAADATPFASLLHFKKETNAAQPRVLIIAPMSGHFATLLRPMVKTMLPHHDVYITDWRNIRDVPLAAGEFGLDAFIDHVIHFLRVIGPGSHVVAVWQSCIGALAAASIMAEDGDPAQPRSMTLIAGPIDTRINPTKVNELTQTKPTAWLERNVITDVPPLFEGARRKVYPGFMQLAAFVSTNPERHIQAFRDMAQAHADNDMTKFQFIKSFYEEYFAVMDLPAEFYLQTVRAVFQDHLLPLGKLDAHGRPVKPGAIRRTALLTLEGERDEICGLGQTLAAQDLCTGLRQNMKAHHVQTGVGHFGLFCGRRWTQEIYPKLRDFIEMSSGIVKPGRRSARSATAAAAASGPA